jgi:hypothetical protein
MQGLRVCVNQGAGVCPAINGQAEHTAPLLSLPLCLLIAFALDSETEG